MARATLDRWIKNGRARRVARGLYTLNMGEPVEEILRRNVFAIAGALFPGAVVSDRSFAVGGLTPENEVTLVADRDADITVGDVSYRVRRGPGALEHDMPWLNSGLHFASDARGVLENARLTRGRKGRSARGLARAELEALLERKRDTLGVEGMNRLREQARAIAPRLGLEEELKTVEQVIGAILGTRELTARSPLLRARLAGIAYDAQRLALCTQLRDALLAVEREPLRVESNEPRVRHLPFFEAYFSNYIEGTIFTLDEAIGIVYHRRIPVARPQDAHDILGTFSIVSDPGEMSTLPRDADEFLEILHNRHLRMMERRPEIRPGEFKQDPNQAGSTIFVHPDRVQGTLIKGFELYRELVDPFARAVYMMFLISEVHPFNDGNGRLARIQMNAELAAGGEERIIVTASMRDGYVGALRTMSGYRNPEPMIRAFGAYQQLTNAIDFSDLDTAREQLERKHIVDDSADDGLEGGLPIDALPN